MSMCTFEVEVDGYSYEYELELLRMTIDGLSGCKKDVKPNGPVRKITVQQTEGDAIVHAWPSQMWLVKDPTLANKIKDTCWKFSGGQACTPTTDFNDPDGRFKRKVSLSEPGATDFVLKVAGKEVHRITLTVVDMSDITIDKDIIPSGGGTEGTAIASIERLEPEGRSLTWSLRECDNLYCDFSAGALTSGSKGGRVIVRASDAEFPSCYREKEVDIIDIRDAGFDSVVAVAGGGKVKATASVYPPDRTLKWYIDNPEAELGCSIDDDGILTTGDKVGTVQVRVEDSEYSDVKAYASIAICSECMPGTPIKIGSVKLIDGPNYCNDGSSGDVEDGTTAEAEVPKALIKLAGECCNGEKYEGEMEFEVFLDNTPGKHDHEVVRISTDCRTIQDIVPKYKVVKFNDMIVMPSAVVNKFDHMVHARIDPCPDDQEIKWKVYNTKDKKYSYESNPDYPNAIEIDTQWGSENIIIEAIASDYTKCFRHKMVVLNNLVTCDPCERKVTPIKACKNKGPFKKLTSDGYLVSGVPHLGPDGITNSNNSNSDSNGNSQASSDSESSSLDDSDSVTANIPSIPGFSETPNVYLGTEIAGCGSFGQTEEGNLVYYSDGSFMVFEQDATTGEYYSLNDIPTKLRIVGSGVNEEIQLVSSEGSVTGFYGFDESISTPGLLKYVTDRYGATKTFEWTSIDDTNKISTITDTYKRKTSYSYYGEDNGYLLKEIETYDGKKQNFQYNKYGQLTAVIMPSILKAAEDNQFAGGTAYVYKYDTDNIRQERRGDLVAIWHPNQTADFIDADSRTVNVERVYSEALPKEQYTYGQEPWDADHYGKLIAKTVGCPEKGIGGTTKYRYTTDSLPENLIDPSTPIVRRIITTEPNGNETIVDINTQGNVAREEVRANRSKITQTGVTSTEGYVTWTRYDDHNRPLLEVYPEGNSTEYKYIKEYDAPVINGEPWPLQIGLLKRKIERIGNPINIDFRENPEGWNQTKAETRYIYDPLFNNILATIDPRGNPIIENIEEITE